MQWLKVGPGTRLLKPLLTRYLFKIESSHTQTPFKLFTCSIVSALCLESFKVKKEVLTLNILPMLIYFAEFFHLKWQQ